MDPNLESELPNPAVSACLTGLAVRFDGGHKKNNFITAVLEPLFQITTVCPEIEAGLGTPRKALQLRLVDGDTRNLVNKNPAIDHTELFLNHSRQRLDSLKHLDGFIFKKKSPSCGAFRVPVVVNDDGYRKNLGLIRA